MDTSKIVEEWFYRLPKGYALAPYTDQELKVLNEVLDENSLSLNEDVDVLDQAFLDAKPVDELKWAPLEELEELQEVLSEAPTRNWEELQSIQEKISAADKQIEWDEFKSVIDASGAKPAVATIKVLNELSEKEQEEFAEKLRTFPALESGISNITGELAIKLFNIDAKGIGKGEVYMCWLYANSSIQGGNESFDIQISNTKYEVKDYSGTGTDAKGNPKENPGAIRVGVEGSISKFPVWRNILDTVDIIQKMEKGDAWNMLPGSSPDHPKHKLWQQLIKIKNYINNRLSYKELIGTKKKPIGTPKSGKIVTGEFSGTDTEEFTQFYKTLNTLFEEFDNALFNQLDAKGPNQKPLTLVIDPVDMSTIQKAAGKELKVKVKSASYDVRPETLVNYWKRIPYLSSTYGAEGSPKRAPEQFGADLQQTVISIIEEGPADYWIVYRGSEKNIKMKTISKARANEFTYYSISQNGVKFREPDTAGTGETPIEPGE